MSQLDSHAFPSIETATGVSQDIQKWIQENQYRLMHEVDQCGAVLLRGFPLKSDLDFDAVVAEFGLTAFTYEESLSNAVRNNRTDKVFTANEAPPDIEIFLHHEMAQTPLYPRKLFFFCETAADEGGATALCRSDLLLEAMKSQMLHFVEQCRAAGLRYTNIMPAEADAESGQGRSWKSTLSCDNREQAESRLAELGYDWYWQEDGSLKATTPVMPAIRSLESGVEVFFNQLIAAFMGWKDARNSGEKSVSFGDGSEIKDEDMQQVTQLAEELTFDLQWQNGDLALVDNFMVMHGRRPFRGQRCVLASFAT